MAQEIKNIVRLDIVDGKPRTFVADEKLQNGYFLEIKGKAKNEILGVEADYEAYKVQKANASTKRVNLLFHASVENQYDERKLKIDFELEAGRPGRGYMLQLGDVVTIPIKLISGGTANVGDMLKLTSDGMLMIDGSGDNAIAVVEAKENIVVPMYQGQWGYNTKVQDVIQESVVIRIA